MTPFVSVIVPCRNEGNSLVRCLDSILALHYAADRIEILVADGVSEDSSRGLLEQYAAADRRIKIIENPARFTPAGLNRALQAATGDYILRVDAHSVIAPDYLTLAVRHLEGSEDWGAGGVMHTESEHTGPFAEPIRMALSHPFGVGNSGFRTSHDAGEPRVVDTLFNACWRRDVFQRIGTFDERLTRSQDIDFSCRIRRAGGRLALLPRMQTTYFAKASFLAFLRQSWINGVWALLPALFLGRLPVSWRHLVPLLFVASLLAAAVAGWTLGRSPWVPVAVVAGPYMILSLAVSAHLAWQRRSLRLAGLLPITMGGLHLAYGAGSLWGAFRVATSLLRRRLQYTPVMPIRRQIP